MNNKEEIILDNMFGDNKPKHIFDEHEDLTEEAYNYILNLDRDDMRCFILMIMDDAYLEGLREMSNKIRSIL